MHRVVVALVMLACSAPAGPSASPAQSATRLAAQAALTAGPPLATPGESMLYKLSLQGVELATYQLVIGEITELAGKQVIVVQSHARATGFAMLLASIDDRFTSWIDITTGHALRFQAEEHASGSKRDLERAVVDFAARDGATIPVTFQLDDAPPRPEPQKVSQPVVWDHNAFLLALRSWEAAPGSTLGFEVFRSRYLWHVDASIHGKDQLVTELGELPALRIDARTYKLDRRGQRDRRSEQRTFTIWISDDDGRVPLEIKATTDHGALRMQIIDYQPGSGRRLRP